MIVGANGITNRIRLVEDEDENIKTLSKFENIYEISLTSALESYRLLSQDRLRNVVLQKLDKFAQLQRNTEKESSFKKG